MDPCAEPFRYIVEVDEGREVRSPGEEVDEAFKRLGIGRALCPDPTDSNQNIVDAIALGVSPAHRLLPFAEGHVRLWAAKDDNPFDAPSTELLKVENRRGRGPPEDQEDNLGLRHDQEVVE